jgi:hypothetical protein
MTTTYRSTFISISIIIGILFLSSCKEISSDPVQDKKIKNFSSSKDISIRKDHTIIVYYFHTTYRCYSCTKISELTKKVLNNQFKKQIESGKIIFKTVNIEKDKNKHYVNKYQLFTKTVVLVDMIKKKQIKYLKLDKTWNYLRDENKFYSYIKDKLTTFIKETS